MGRDKGEEGLQLPIGDNSEGGWALVIVVGMVAHDGQQRDIISWRSPFRLVDKSKSLSPGKRCSMIGICRATLFRILDSL